MMVIIHLLINQAVPPNWKQAYQSILKSLYQGEAAIVAHVKATNRIIEFMEACDAEQEAAYSNPPDDLPQDMSLNNLAHNYSTYSNTSSDRSMELDGYHWDPAGLFRILRNYTCNRFSFR